MPWRSMICCLVGAWVLAGATAASAQRIGRTEVFLSSADTSRMVTFFGSAGAPTAAPSAGFDYAVFAAELVAYLTKELVPGSADEYRYSLLGSHLSPTVPKPRSEFGSHCLEVVTRLGSAVRGLGGDSPGLGAARPSALAYAARAGSTALVLREMWTAFKNDVEDTRHGVSLKPKVGGGRFSVSFTVRW